MPFENLISKRVIRKKRKINNFSVSGSFGLCKPLPRNFIFDALWVICISQLPSASWHGLDLKLPSFFREEPQIANRSNLKPQQMSPFSDITGDPTKWNNKHRHRVIHMAIKAINIFLRRGSFLQRTTPKSNSLFILLWIWRWK